MAKEIPATWMGRMKAQAMRSGKRIRPMADQAKLVTAHRFEEARYWAAPRLEEAAHRVEDEIAPKVSRMMTKAAKKIDPTPPKSRRWPVIVLMTGVAVGGMGYLFYRRNAQQWTEHMKDSASDASQWVDDRAEKTAGSAEKVASKIDDKMS
ncbi:hypothetical protein [Nonomuraea sediminis]|uniref:hypothetical protein n=1 Tax=Nonomuraea sediminis TaxID=2835864 RepID=UPI001BDBE7BD|nr:hypothetical protein [Nonomuraea sediminis]